MALQIDTWPWGREQIVWGFSPEHKYTFKILEPKKGREGCLSLQYHNQKSETWLVVRGVAWALIADQRSVTTRVMRAGDIQNLPAGTLHRLMGISDDCQVAEPSTPDAHAADKSAPKDVIRLHCVLGRQCAAPRDASEAAIVAQCVRITEDAIAAIERGEIPAEIEGKISGVAGDRWRIGG